MKISLLPSIITALYLLCSNVGTAQNTSALVYNILQTNCTFSSCHSSSTKAGNLDLEGSGANPGQAVFNNLYDVDPTNPTAKSKGFKRVYPGDPYRSTLFRKINKGLDSWIKHDPAEGQEMPVGNTLSEFDREIVRQWILFGSPLAGEVVDTSLIGDYYRGNGIPSFQKIPDPPEAGEGYQIKVGPFFVAPLGFSEGDEVEYNYLYDLKNMAATEINRVDVHMNENSHHMILYRRKTDPTGIPRGLRTTSDHSNIEMVVANQRSDSTILPTGTAFAWDANTVLDVNTHYLNYRNQVLAAEVYLNLYTQPSGTARQYMNTALLVNPALYVENTGDTVSVETPAEATFKTDQRFIWMMSSHTHKYGVDFDVWMRNNDLSKGEHLFDGTHINGDPTMPGLGYYDYQHPPVRFWEYPFKPYKRFPGLIHRAKYVNDGPDDVAWGETSDDEMMITILMYLKDTTGLGVLSSVNEQTNQEKNRVLVYPNPFKDRTHFVVNNYNRPWSLQIYDMFGRKVKAVKNIESSSYSMDREGMASGVYFYRMVTDQGFLYDGRLIVE